MDAPSSLDPPGAAPPPRPPEGGRGPRRLRRRPDDGHIAGVCAGVAEYFDVDPMIVRIAAVVLLFSGPGFIAYVLAWIFVPAKPGPARYGEPRPPIDRRDRGTQIFGIVLLGLGVSVIWGDWWAPARGWLFPLGLMALGAWLLLRPDRDDDLPVPPVPPVPPTPSWSASGAPPVTQPVSASEAPDRDAVGTVVADDPEGEDDTAVLPTTESDAGSGGTGWGPPPDAPWDVPPPPVPGVPVATPHHHRPRHRHRHLVGPIVFGALLIWTGLAWLAGVGLTTGLAVGLVILGVGCVLGSFVGGSPILILPAILLALSLAAMAIVDVPLHGPIGQHTWSPDSVDELAPGYEVSMGEGVLDLSDLGTLRSAETVRGSVGFGHLVVLVAEDQRVDVNVDIGAGEAVVFGERQNGVGVESHEGYGGRGATLTLDLEAGMGQIEVRRIEPGRTLPVDPPDEDEAPDPTTPSTLG